MKICLINPKYSCGQRAHRIPLGLSYIAAVLKEHGYKVDGYNLDVDIEPDFSKYDAFGVYVSTPMLKQANKLIFKLIKHGPVIIGGPHPSSNIDLKTHPDVIRIAGEGEYAFLKVVQQLEKGTYNFLGIPGVSHIPTNYNNPQGKPTDLNKLPFPAKEVFDHGNYKDRPYAYGAIIASRGCPFRCKNCQPGLKMISPYRIRNPNTVVHEMATLYDDHGVRDFSFEDSELIISKKWTLDLCEGMITQFNKNRSRITFQGNARLHQLGDEVLVKLKEAGCRRLGIGLESGSQRVLDKCLNKDINLKKDLLNINKIKGYGIESHVWIMIGIPGETEKDIKKTTEMVKNLDVSTVEINIATPWPGTYFYEEAKKKGWLVEANVEDFDEKRTSVFKTPYLFPERVKELFEEFKQELQKKGWIKWSHESNTFAKRPTTKEILKVAANKIKRGDIFITDISILKDWIKNKVISKCRGMTEEENGKNKINPNL